MDVLVDVGRADRWRTAWLALLTLVALVVGHETVFALRYGVGDDLATALLATGHGQPYAWLVGGSVVAGLVLAAASTARLWRLHRRLHGAARARRSAPSDGATVSVRAQWLELARPLTLRTLLLFAGLENVEHLFLHGHIEGLAVYLTPDTLWVAPVLLAVSLGIAAVGALVRWRERILEAQLAARTGVRPRALPIRGPGRWALIAALCRHRLVLLARDLGRAPPALASS